MRFKHIIAMVSAATVALSPVAAAANPARSLSVAKVSRASAPAAKSSKLGEGSGGIAGLVIGAGVLAIVVIAVVNSKDDDESDSN